MIQNHDFGRNAEAAVCDELSRNSTTSAGQQQPQQQQQQDAEPDLDTAEQATEVTLMDELDKIFIEESQGKHLQANEDIIQGTIGTNTNLAHTSAPGQLLLMN